MAKSTGANPQATFDPIQRRLWSRYPIRRTPISCQFVNMSRKMIIKAWSPLCGRWTNAGSKWKIRKVTGVMAVKPCMTSLIAEAGQQSSLRVSWCYPPIFNNIYKGALGEVCGRYIPQEQLGLQPANWYLSMKSLTSRQEQRIFWFQTLEWQFRCSCREYNP